MYYYQGSQRVMLDAKSRIAVPSEHRTLLHEQCGGAMTITRGAGEHCLWLFPRPTWLRFRENLRRQVKASNRALHSHFVHNARDLEIDKAGRITIPPVLRELAGIDGPSVFFAGDADYFELWDWDRHQATTRTIDFGAMPDSVLDFGDEPEAADA